MGKRNYAEKKKRLCGEEKMQQQAAKDYGTGTA